MEAQTGPMEANQDAVAEKASAAEKNGVPTEAVEVPTEASATSAEGEDELDQCCYVAKKGNKGSWCQNMATVILFSRIKHCLIYCQDCNDLRKLTKRVRQTKRRKSQQEAKVKEEMSQILDVVENVNVATLGHKGSTGQVCEP